MGECVTESTAWGSPQIAVGKLPLHVNEASGHFLSIVGLVVAASVLICFRVSSWSDALSIITLVAVLFSPVAVFLWWSFRSRFSRRPTPSLRMLLQLRNSEPGLSDVVADERITKVIRELEAKRSFWKLNSRSCWTPTECEAALALHGIPKPRTVVDEAAVPQLLQIPLPSHMLEPEPVQQSSEIPRGQITTMILLAVLLALIVLAFGNWMVALYLLGIAVMFSLGLPEVRDALPIFQTQQSETIIGLGTLVDRHNQQWTVDDSVMLVQCKRNVGPLIVTLVGETRETTLTFTDEKDQYFIALWQRWNHPSPRPELLPT